MRNLKGLAPVIMAAASYCLLPAPTHAAISASVIALSQECAPSVHPATMAYVVSHESANNPYAIGINDGPRLETQPTSRSEAIEIAERLMTDGRSFDSGLGQIHSGNLKGLGLSIADLFDPCQNLRAAAVILEGCFDRAGQGGAAEAQLQLRQALSCYNTNSMSAGFSNGYVQRVTEQLAYDVPELLPEGAPGAEGPVRITARQTSDEAQQGEPGVVEVRGGGDVFDKARPDAFANVPGHRKEISIADDNRFSAKSFIDHVQVSTGRD